jgi:16S rRNA processing protein RimM
LNSDEWVTIAVLGKVRGVRGELTAFRLSGKPERYQNLKDVFLFAGEAKEGERRRVESVWEHDGRLIFKFEEIDSIDEAQPLVGAEVRVPKAERVALDPGEYFEEDLLGCEVVNRRDGKNLGRVTAWQDGGGAGLLEVEGGLLIPFARSICVAIDPAAQRIEVDLPEGLLDLNPR